MFETQKKKTRKFWMEKLEEQEKVGLTGKSGEKIDGELDVESNRKNDKQSESGKIIGALVGVVAIFLVFAVFMIFHLNRTTSQTESARRLQQKVCAKLFPFDYYKGSPVLVNVTKNNNDNFVDIKIEKEVKSIEISEFCQLQVVFNNGRKPYEIDGPNKIPTFSINVLPRRSVS